LIADATWPPGESLCPFLLAAAQPPREQHEYSQEPEVTPITEAGKKKWSFYFRGQVAVDEPAMTQRQRAPDPAIPINNGRNPRSGGPDHRQALLDGAELGG